MTTAVATRAVTTRVWPVPPERCDAGAEREEFIRRLYTDHRADLLRQVLGQNGGDFQRAEDLVQETMLRAWLHADELTPQKGSVCGWLRRVARNTVIDAHRARLARPAEVPAETAGGQTVKDPADCVVTSVVVRRALSSLRPIYRDVLLEAYYRGRSHQEIADALGIPVGTVKSRTFNALTALRLLLNNDVP